MSRGPTGDYAVYNGAQLIAANRLWLCTDPSYMRAAATPDQRGERCTRAVWTEGVVWCGGIWSMTVFSRFFFGESIFCLSPSNWQTDDASTAYSIRIRSLALGKLGRGEVCGIINVAAPTD